MSSAQMTSQQNKQWLANHTRLGLDPEKHTRPVWRFVAASDLDHLARMIGATRLAYPLRSPMNDQEPDKAADPRLQRSIVHHGFGLGAIEDAGVRAEIERRYQHLPFQVMSAPDITVTAQKPLVINTTQSVVNYGKVTIEAGGYIQIEVPCHFTAQLLEKTGGTVNPGNPDGQYDIVITGSAGQPGQAGSNGQAGANGGNGDGGHCDCCGGIAKNNGTDGSAGGNGSDGLDGQAARRGADAPSVVFAIDDLRSTLTMLNVGGAGGNGGNGGNGGTGGTGGAGGSDKQCGAEYCDGGNGGAGGSGGNAGNGGNSGDGGQGGTSVMFFKSTNGSTVLVTNGTAQPGAPGTGGSVGAGGAGGPGGGRGARDGGSGQPGSKAGKNGTYGIAGQPGSVQINPPAA